MGGFCPKTGYLIKIKSNSDFGEYLIRNNITPENAIYKVIASTDVELNLPQISQQYINIYKSKCGINKEIELIDII